MAKLSAKDEKRLLGSIEKAITLANDGMSPNEAIEKVAREESYTPPFITRMCTAFNKSKSVATFTKEADASKKKCDFALADPKVVISTIYGEDKEASAKPVMVFSGNIRELPVMQKAASKVVDMLDEYHSLSPSAMISRIDKCRSAHQLLQKQMHAKEAKARHEFEDCLNKIASHVKSMPKEAIERMSQLVVNGYPDFGHKMLTTISKKTSREIPLLEKCAEAAVFPPREPYFAIANANVLAEAFLKAHNDNIIFNKYAEGVVGGVLDELGNVIAGSAGLAGGNDKEIAKIKSPEDDLDPQFFNALKEVDTRKNFADLVLYDKDLAQYDMPTLVTAFNAATSTVPESVNNPPTLKTLMLQHINTGGVADPFQLEKSLKINQMLAKQTAEAKTKLDSAKEKSKTEAKAKWYEDRQTSSEPGILTKILEKAQGGGSKGDKKDKGEGKSGRYADNPENRKSMIEDEFKLDPKQGKGSVPAGKITQVTVNGKTEAVSNKEVYNAVEKKIDGEKLTPKDQEILQVLSGMRNW